MNGRCDQCFAAPATTTTWFRLAGTSSFVSTERCDTHPYQPRPSHEPAQLAFALATRPRRETR